MGLRNGSRLIGSTGVIGHLYRDSKAHGANMGPIWGRQDPGGPHVCPMSFAIWGVYPIKYHSLFVPCFGWVVLSITSQMIHWKIPHQLTSLQNKCRTTGPDQQNWGRSGRLSIFIIYKFGQNCALVQQVSDLILKTDSLVLGQWYDGCAKHWTLQSEWVSEWLNLTAFLGTADSAVHIVHIICVITAHTLESLSSLT